MRTQVFTPVRQKKMWEIVRTFYGVAREDGVRMSLGLLLRCKVCGDYFWDKAKAMEHKHDRRAAKEIRGNVNAS